MSRSTSLQPASDATATHVTALELQVAARETELDDLKAALQALQARYLDKIGPLYAELIPLDADVAEAEIKAGLRVPDADPDDTAESGDAGTLTATGCSTAAPSGDLKRMFRDVARAIHPDALPDAQHDERTRYRRHSLMAEANRAYAERDEDRLRLILHGWALDPELAAGDEPENEQARLQRRAATLSARLAQIEAEFADVGRTAIGRLKTKIDDARAQGWDLFAEMIRQVTREIALARAKLKRLARRQGPN
jgi:hypothetical protein